MYRLYILHIYITQLTAVKMYALILVLTVTYTGLKFKLFSTIEMFLVTIAYSIV